MSKTSAGDDYCALFDHEQGRQIPPGQLREMGEVFSTCFTHLSRETGLLATMRSGSGHKIEVPARFSVADVRVEARLDLAFLGADGMATVVDWKVGESDTSDYSLQLLIYGLAVELGAVWASTPASRVDLLEVNLLKGQTRCLQASRPDFARAEDFIYQSAVEMRQIFGTDSFRELNLDDLDVARSPETCVHCKYTKLCIQGLTEADKIEEAVLIQGRLL